MLGVAKKCAKCDKQVYPVEELKCLDKVWHKLCFKCTVCGMVLNMKNYKGFEKQPYCSTHYPQQRPIFVADNPEIQRIKENTKIQSNVKYHGDYEKNKDKYTPIVDNLEINRAMENQKLVSDIEYKSLPSKNKENNYLSRPDSFGHISMAVTYKAGEKQNDRNQFSRKIGSIADYDPLSYESSLLGPLSKESSEGKQLSKDDEQLYTKAKAANAINSNFDSKTKSASCRAIYDHDAHEDDEITFRDGDVFLECQCVDVGWMVGIHEKTGKYGFFPSNYVEPL